MIQFLSRILFTTLSIFLLFISTTQALFDDDPAFSSVVATLLKNPASPLFKADHMKTLGVSEEKYRNAKQSKQLDQLQSIVSQLKQKKQLGLRESSPEESARVAMHQGILYTLAANLISESGTLYQPKCYAFQDQKLETFSKRAGARFLHVADYLKDKENLKEAYKMYTLATVALRLPINGFQEVHRGNLQFQKTGRIGAQTLANMEDLLKDSASLPAENVHYTFFSPFKDSENPLLSLRQWRIFCLRMAGYAKDIQRGDGKEWHYSNPFAPELKALYEGAIAIAVNDANAEKESLRKARKLESAAKLVLSLFWEMKKYDKSGTQVDNREGESYWSQYCDLSQQAANEFMERGHQKQAGLNDQEVANNFFHGIHLIVLNVRTSLENLEGSLRCLRLTQEGIAFFGSNVAKTCPYFYKGQVTPEESCPPIFGGRNSGPNLTIYLLDRIYNAVWELFEKEVKALKKEDVKDAKAEVVDPFLGKYTNAIHALSGNNGEIISVPQFGFVTSPDYRKPLNDRMNGVLKKYGFPEIDM